MLTATEVEAVLAVPDVNDPLGLRDRAILEALYSTGVRRSELVRGHVFDVDVERGTIRIREGKRSNDRVVPTGQRALAWIEKYQRDGASNSSATRTALCSSCPGSETRSRRAT